MISSEVERTLVKSPPELWSELSNPDALARHLSELGEIRITRVEPEHAVEWEAGDTAGTVRIKPSGWGTKVTLTVTRKRDVEATPHGAGAGAPERAQAPRAYQGDLERPTPADLEPLEPASPPAPPTPANLEPPAPADRPAPPRPADLAPADPPAPAAEREPVASTRERQLPMRVSELAHAAEPKVPEPQARPGFFRRLFGSRRARTPAEEQAIAPIAADTGMTPARPAPASAQSLDAFAALRQALSAETLAAVDPFSAPRAAAGKRREQSREEPPAQKPAADVSAELKAAEEVAEEEVTAVLTAVLDRLGAAHHRPFSRA
jgi:hypothetical protein